MEAFLEVDWTSAIVAWLTVQGLRIAVIIVIAVALRVVGIAFLKRLVRRIVHKGALPPSEAEKKRGDTFSNIVAKTLALLIWVVAGLMILSEVGVNIAPLLAAAGAAGIAVGFGGQYFIRDLIAGTVILLENQFGIGDVVCLDGTCGLVEDMTLRLTTLRDLDGVVHHVPNGEIKVASNMSKSYSRVNLNIGIAYDTDLEHVIEVVNRTGKELAEDPQWASRIVTAPQFLRVDDFADSAIVVKIVGDTRPSEQWAVTGELRKRLKLAFDKENINIPFPQRVVHHVNQA